MGNTSTEDFTLKSRELISDVTNNNNVPPVTAQLFNIDDFFKNPISSIQNFYSRNEKLFAENLQGNYPASTVPLQNTAVDINTRILLKSTEDSTENIKSTSETTSTTESTTEKEVETAESVVENRKVNPNHVAPLQTNFPLFLEDTTNATPKNDTNSNVSNTNVNKLSTSAKFVEELNENSITLSESTTTQHTTQTERISNLNQTATTDVNTETAPINAVEEITNTKQQATIKQ